MTNTSGKKDAEGKDVAELRDELLQSDPNLAARWRASEPRRKLAHALINMRTDANLTQKQLADQLNWEQPQVSRMESATGPWPRQESLQAYANACGVGVGVVFVRASDQHKLHIDSAVSFGNTEMDELLELISDMDVD